MADDSPLLLALELVGIFVFALSGGLVAVRKHLDIFGVLVLAGATGLGGGFLRDVLIDATPPAARNQANACSRSARRSSTASMPVESRMSPSVTPAWRLASAVIPR